MANGAESGTSRAGLATTPSLPYQRTLASVGYAGGGGEELGGLVEGGEIDADVVGAVVGDRGADACVEIGGDGAEVGLIRRIHDAVEHRAALRREAGARGRLQPEVAVGVAARDADDRLLAVGEHQRGDRRALVLVVGTEPEDVVARIASE